MLLTSLLLLLLSRTSCSNQDATLDATSSELLEFCRFLSIHPSNCSCGNSSLVCQFTNFGKTIKDNGTRFFGFQRNEGISFTYATIAFISSVFGMVGNAAVICLAYRQRSRLSPCKLHIAELAVTNFIFSIFQIVNVTPLYWTNVWIYGRGACKLMKGVLEIGSLLSSGFFHLISVQRYFYIVPTYDFIKVKRFCRRYKHILPICNLFLVAITVAPLLYGLDIEPNSQRCVNFTEKNKQIASFYTWFTFIVHSLLPIGVITVLSIKLKIHFSTEASSSMMVSQRGMNKRSISHMFLVLVLFIVCTLPARLFTIVITMMEFKSRSVLLGFQLTAYTLYSLQGTLNPIL